MHQQQLPDGLAKPKPVDASIHVEPSSCGCRNPHRQCNKVVLESKRHFAIRIFSADEKGDRGLESWDLSIFRSPRSEKWKSTIVNEEVSTLELQFVGENGMCRLNIEPPDFC